jgi:CelD/BcsL family acetyltransferase involved in cellulose biosynthesis
MTLSYDCRKLAELTSEHRDAWRRLQLDQPHLDQPFLCLEFAEAADEFRGCVEVAIATLDGKTVGLVPFHRVGKRRAVPLADGMNEYQALIVDANADLNQRQWMAAAGLGEYCFDHLALVNARNRATSHTTGPCPFADLSGGFDNYCETLKQRGSRTIRETLRKQRKLSREIGEVRFQLETDSTEAFDALIRWKQTQHKRTDVYDTFAHDSVIDFLRRVWKTQTPQFSGFLCTLHAGDSLVAVHLGIRTSRVAHMWFPAYDADLQNYSPGLVMMQEMTKALADQGIQRLDFGPGPQRYKRSLATDAYDVGIGEITANPCTRWLKQRWRVARQNLKNRGLGNWLRSPAKWLHTLRQRQAFDTAPGSTEHRTP